MRLPIASAVVAVLVVSALITLSYLALLHSDVLPIPEARAATGLVATTTAHAVGRTRPQNILLMEPVSNPSCLVWQPGRGRLTRPLSREPNNPYLTDREVRAQQERRPPRL